MKRERKSVLPCAAVGYDPGPVESVLRIGEHIETMTLTRDKLTVSYSGPPIPQELQAELAKFWRERLDKIMWKLMGVEHLANPSTLPGGEGALAGLSAHSPRLKTNSRADMATRFDRFPLSGLKFVS